MKSNVTTGRGTEAGFYYKRDRTAADKIGPQDIGTTFAKNLNVPCANGSARQWELKVSLLSLSLPPQLLLSPPPVRCRRSL